MVISLTVSKPAPILYYWGIIVNMYLKIKVIPDAKQEKVEKLSDDSWRVWVKVPAENNAANTRVLELVRSEFPSTSIRIVSGHHSPSKIISIN
jgi:uncharacterized protein YggU (UPF0235/DUF167 family)